MRKIIMFNMISADGFFAGTDGNIDWHTVDDDFNHFAIDVLSRVDTIIFGRTTYEMFESYWPDALKDPATGKEDLVIAQVIDDAKKIVFSKTRTDVNWKNSELKSDISESEIRKLKEQDGGKDIIIYGSSTIVQQLSRLGLIDEYRFMVSPTILGAGKSLFKEPLKFKLIDFRPFKSGNVLLSYRPAEQ